MDPLATLAHLRKVRQYGVSALPQVPQDRLYSHWISCLRSVPKLNSVILRTNEHGPSSKGPYQTQCLYCENLTGLPKEEAPILN